MAACCRTIVTPLTTTLMVEPEIIVLGSCCRLRVCSTDALAAAMLTVVMVLHTLIYFHKISFFI